MYTSFKGFQLVGIWQEKLQIIVITDIKQRIVIIQLVAKQRVVYYCQLKSFPLNNFNVSYAIYSATSYQINAICLISLTCLKHLKDFWGQIWVSAIYASAFFAIILIILKFCFWQQAKQYSTLYNLIA